MSGPREPAATSPVPVLVLAVGNPSRGDDALGPELAARLEAAALPGVEVITEFQLQVENALDLVGRERVLFVDAATGTPAPFELRRVEAAAEFLHTSHALSPEAVLATYQRVEAAAEFLHTSHALSPEAVLATYQRISGEAAPESWVLCVRGESFELGEGLSSMAEAHAGAAWIELRRWLGSSAA